MAEQLTAVWIAVADRLKNEIPSHSYATFFADLELISFEEDEAVIGVGNRFLLEWLKSRYINNIEQAFAETTGRLAKVRFEIKGRIFRKLRQRQLESNTNDDGPHVETPSIDGPPRRSKLRPEYKMNNFVIGECNRVAYSAAKSIIETPALKYNPKS